METPIDEIIALTLKKLDETEEILDDAVEFGEPSFDLRTLIRGLVEECAAATVDEAPLREIGEWKTLRGTATDLDGRQMVPLPPDFRRLLYIRMTGWNRAVYTTVAPDSDMAGLLRLWSRRAGSAYVRPRPGVAITPYGARTGLAAEVFGRRAGAAVEAGAYLPQPRLEGDKLRFPRSLLPRLTDRLAALISNI